MKPFITWSQIIFCTVAPLTSGLDGWSSEDYVVILQNILFSPLAKVGKHVQNKARVLERVARGEQVNTALQTWMFFHWQLQGSCMIWSKWYKDQIKYSAIFLDFLGFWFEISVLICIQVMLIAFCHIKPSATQWLSFPVSLVLVVSFLPHCQFPVPVSLEKPCSGLPFLLPAQFPFQAQIPFLSLL